MATINEDYLDDLVKRFKGFKSPNETQELIILLGEKDNRSDDDNRKLWVLLNAEKKADQLAKARADARRLIDAEKGKERKARTRRMMILASAVESAIKQDSEVETLMRQVIQKVDDGGYILDRDQEVIKDTLEAILDTSANAPDFR
ncbi:hypothetical protein [Psychrobacter sp. BF1]|uniref:hypothetical protein n=1 Tax=Psychrobacter sp. BF1 TaxID=2821147 RepID=UPI001C4DFA9A|nr:hypothetical protein [Psychrobacter sp. BF1]